MIHSRAEEFHGVSVFDNSIDVWLAGYTDTSAYMLFDGAQFGPSDQENMYLDQTNETVICAANCYFNSAWRTPCVANQPCGAIEIGPDAKKKGTGLTSIVAQFNQGLFSSAVPYDVYFDTDPATGRYCHCRVALGDGMIDVATQGSNPGQPTTNNPALLTGPTSYAPPTFANAASVGVPLTLGPAEFGIGLSTDTETAPQGAGLKLRVECNHDGTAKLVVLAGNSNTETTLANEIGGGVCKQ